MSSKKGMVKKVYDYLLMRLLRTDYKPNDRLIISRIANACGVSDTPVREALRLLESEGYIRNTANRGATVIGFTKKNMQEISEIKGVLEGYMTRESIDFLSPHDLRVLSNINEQMRQAAIEKDFSRFAELNLSFHNTIYKHFKEGEWMRLLNGLRAKWHFTGQVFSIAPARMDESCSEHETLLELIAERKYDEVEQYTRFHKQKALESWSASLPEGNTNKD